MKSALSAIALALVLVASAAAWAGLPVEMPVPALGPASVIHGGNHAAAASRDTLYLIGPWGSGAAVNGQFEDPAGAPAWNDWTSVDYTQQTEEIWHVDTYNVVSGVYSAWCGEITFDACSDEDVEGGYGPGYYEWLTWYGAVGDPSVPATVHLTATVNHDTEPGFDYSSLDYWVNGSSHPNYLWRVDGTGVQVPIDVTVTYLPGEYVGETDNQVRISWIVQSDYAWDDSDCSYQSAGALQVDDITVTVTNDGAMTSYFHDFEDGTLGEWIPEFPTGVGDYAHLRTNLRDEDPCASNYSPAVCFMADEIMLAERGLPVESCLDWCYGPGGYIVNWSGGAAGPDYHIHNAIVSPPVAWPGDQYEGLWFAFDVYRHETLTADSPGIFFTWAVNSTTWEDPIGLSEEKHNWQDRNFVYYGGPSWDRFGDFNLCDLLLPDARWIEIRMAVYELGYLWGWYGANGTPAPYFDNVLLQAYRQEGPAMNARTLDLAQDAFPADGQIHAGADMDQNDVRFDMANNIALATDMRNDPGDSIVITIEAVRSGAALVETDVDAMVKAPRMHWTLRPGPAVSVSWRLNLAAAGFTGTDGSGNLVGEMPGAHAVGNGHTSPDRWMFDLPDEDFLFPGDVIHYYFEAWDVATGEYESASLPVERAGYGVFNDPLAYHSDFTMHALPTLFDDAGDQVRILFWNDFANYGGQDEWHRALHTNSAYFGCDYDVYYTHAPDSGVGNGLGGRAQFGQLDGYDVLLYSAGHLGVNTISNLDYEQDAGDDVGVVNHWLEQGEKFLFATGDNLVSDLVGNGGAQTQTFASSWLGVAYVGNDVRPLLGGDVAPTVYSVPGNPVLQIADQWIAYGGCPGIHSFDAFTANGGEQLAFFGDGTSGLAAAVRYVAPNGSTAITLPYDFSAIWTSPSPTKVNQPASIAAREYVLRDVLASAGFIGISFPTAVGDEAPSAFGATAYPNPFNPSTRIEYHLPHAGHASVKIFDLHGRHVRTLLDETCEAGPDYVMWNGTDDGGRGVSSGVYFYEIRGAGKVKTNKIVMLK